MSTSGSLASRLTLWFTVSTFCLVSIATGVLYWSVARTLTTEDGLFMFDKILTVTHLLESHATGPQLLKERVEKEWVERQFERAYVRVLDVSGKSMTETPGFETISSSIFEAVPLTENKRSDQLIKKKDLETGRIFKVKTVRVSPGLKTPQAWTVQIALDRTSEETVLAAYRSRLFLVLALTLIITALIGRRIVLRGLRPVADIATSAKRIRSTTLHERINIANTPSELTVLANTFNEMLDRLNESFERLSQFSSDIAHDLRTPINNLRGELEVALGKPRTPEEYQDVLGSCLEECDRITLLIDSLLFLARAENPKEKLTKEALNLKQEVQTLCEFFEVSASEKGIQLKFDVPPEISIVADRVFVQRALGNLISNALHATPKAGTITLFASEGDSLFYVGVTDTGSGIPPEHLPRVFDRFYRADSTRSAKRGGSGLGLAIVQSIMALHQGKAEITSEVGRGTTVTLLFPRT